MATKAAKETKVMPRPEETQGQGANGAQEVLPPETTALAVYKTPAEMIAGVGATLEENGVKLSLGGLTFGKKIQQKPWGKVMKAVLTLDDKSTTATNLAIGGAVKYAQDQGWDLRTMMPLIAPDRDLKTLENLALVASRFPNTEVTRDLLAGVPSWSVVKEIALAGGVDDKGRAALLRSVAGKQTTTREVRAMVKSLQAQRAQKEREQRADNREARETAAALNAELFQVPTDATFTEYIVLKSREEYDVWREANAPLAALNDARRAKQEAQEEAEASAEVQQAQAAPAQFAKSRTWSKDLTQYDRACVKAIGEYLSLGEDTKDLEWTDGAVIAHALDLTLKFYNLQVPEEQPAQQAPAPGTQEVIPPDDTQPEDPFADDMPLDPDFDKDPLTMAST